MGTERSDPAHPTPPPQAAITGLILAGGRGRRMGGADKGLIAFRGKPLVQWVAHRLRPQVGPLLISANRTLDRYRTLGDPVVQDAFPDFPGPLAGIASGLAASETPYLAIVPCDSPWLPTDLVAGLYRALIRRAAPLSVAHDGQRSQPTFCLIRRTLLPDLQASLARGERTLRAWQERHRPARADFSHVPEAFFNLNRPEDWVGLRERSDPDA